MSVIKQGPSTMREFLFVVFVMFVANCTVTVVDFIVYHYVSGTAFTVTD